MYYAREITSQLDGWQELALRIERQNLPEVGEIILRSLQRVRMPLSTGKAHRLEKLDFD